MRALASLLLLLTFVGACELLDGSGTPEDALIRTDRSTYALGEAIEVTVSNPTNRSLFLENCCGPIILGVERQQGDGWADYRPGACLALCLSVPLELPPGQTRAAPSMMLEDPGRYRLTAGFWLQPRADDAIQRLYSAPFTVK